MSSFTIKDSGARQEFSGGMVRDTAEGKIDFTSCLHGPMFSRWNDHLTKGRQKYPDPRVGVPNWTLGAGDPTVLDRAKQSAFRHFVAWLNGETDEDHAAGVYFNINLAEYVKESRVIGEAQADDQAALPPRLETQEEIIREYGPGTGRNAPWTETTAPGRTTSEIAKGPVVR